MGILTLRRRKTKRRKLKGLGNSEQNSTRNLELKTNPQEHLDLVNLKSQILRLMLENHLNLIIKKMKNLLYQMHPVAKGAEAEVKVRVETEVVATVSAVVVKMKLVV